MQAAQENQALDGANHYATHLADLNNHQEVISTEDICAKNGLLLVRKGSRITQDVAQRILYHKLLKPIENQVKLENTLTMESLQRDINSLFGRYPDLRTVHTANRFDTELKTLVNSLSINAVLYQKLTVLSVRQPEVYEKALFCAWLCALIATHQALSKQEIHDAFIAGLFHDIGLLHIDPMILKKEGALTQDEWRAIQSHVVIGYLIFKDSDISNPNVARAILEHHECCDGTGYPKGKSAEQLGILGQILACADSIQAVRISRFKDGGRTIRDTLPLLHMNSGKHFLTVYKTICVLILNSQLAVYEGNPYQDYQAYLDRLIERVDKLQDAIVVLVLICDLAQMHNAQDKFNCCLHVVDPVILMIRSSGMVRDELTIWLKKIRLREDPDALRDLNEYDLMQNELLWQLKMAVRVINEFIEHADFLTSQQREHFHKLTGYINSAVVFNH